MPIATNRRSPAAVMRSSGCRSLPDDPDAVFVEDTALLLDAHAVITRPGAASRADETGSTAHGLPSDFELHRIERGFLDGGDVLRIGRRLYVGPARPVPMLTASPHSPRWFGRSASRSYRPSCAIVFTSRPGRRSRGRTAPARPCCSTIRRSVDARAVRRGRAAGGRCRRAGRRELRPRRRQAHPPGRQSANRRPVEATAVST